MPVFEIKLQLKSIDHRLYALRSLEAGVVHQRRDCQSISPGLHILFDLVPAGTLYHPTTHMDVTFVYLNSRQSSIWWIHPF